MNHPQGVCSQAMVCWIMDTGKANRPITPEAHWKNEKQCDQTAWPKSKPRNLDHLKKVAQKFSISSFRHVTITGSRAKTHIFLQSHFWVICHSGQWLQMDLNNCNVETTISSQLESHASHSGSTLRPKQEASESKLETCVNYWQQVNHWSDCKLS